MTEVVLTVAPEWLETDDVSLDIVITGINDGHHEHGTQQMLASATGLLAQDEFGALVQIIWTTDTMTTHSPETYTVCVQPIVDGLPFGNESCRSFVF